MGKSHHKPILGAVAALLILAAIGLILTSGGSAPVVVRSQEQNAGSQAPIVDQSPLQTARNLEGKVSSPDERELAEQAARLADHEVDLAFDSALREAAQHPAPVTPEARQLDSRVKAMAAKVAGEQERVSQLEKDAANAPADRKAALEQNLQLLQAQLELDKDELEDAQQDLMRAGGGTQDKIERMRDEHEAAVHPTAPAPAPTGTAKPASAELNANPSTLVEQLQSWSALRSLREQVANAQQQAMFTANSLTRSHEAYEKSVAGEQGAPRTPNPATAGTASTGADPQNGATNPNSGQLVSLRHRAEDQKVLAEFDKRVQDEQELADVYGAWLAVLKARQRTLAHDILQSLAWILIIALIVVAIDYLIDRFFTHLAPDRKRLRNLRTVLRFAVQAIGVLAALFVVVGKPAQLPTILGLAGAGLTVALKDFIVAFVGWFVLMGRNGIRVGDWVEIEGVGGEVVEIGLLRTVLLEAGNWTDAGHPTGRKVAFVNSFAIEGHFFNFSTSGQWLWDQFDLLIPAERDPYPLIQQVRQIVERETGAGTREAEEEWQRVTYRYGLKAFTAQPAIDVQPTSSGVKMVVRYITRAHERHAVRARLNQAMVELLHGRRLEAEDSCKLAAKSAGERD